MKRVFETPQELQFGEEHLVIQRLLASGMTAEVYEATLKTPEGDKRVAVKAMKALDFPLARKMFLQEAQVLARLMSLEEEESDYLDEELKIAPVYFGKGETDSGTPYLVMEFIEGTQIPDALREQGPFPEYQSLVIIWHLYRLLYLLHSHLSLSFIDLKFENLWWVPVPNKLAGGQLKVTDLGTLEEIKPGRQRGVQRDLLLAGVYFFALLSGRIIRYSFGELKEDAEVLIRQYRDRFSWGVWNVLRRLLNRNPEARPQTAQEVLDSVRELIEFWSIAPQELKQRADRFLTLAEAEMAEARYHNRAISQEGRKYAELALSALDILRLRDSALFSEETMQKARAALSASDYFERGLALLQGFSFSLARKVFEEGIPFDENPVRLRHWSYVAEIGEEVPLESFKARFEEIKSILEFIHNHPPSIHLWEAARRDLEALTAQQEEKPSLQSRGLQYLIHECRLYELAFQAREDEFNGRFTRAAEAYASIQKILDMLPPSSRKMIEEEIGNVAAARRVDELQKREEQARQCYEEAAAILDEKPLHKERGEGGEEYSLVCKISEAIQLAPEFPFHLRRIFHLLSGILKRIQTASPPEVEEYLHLFYQVVEHGYFLQSPEFDYTYGHLISMALHLQDAYQAVREFDAFSFAQAFEKLVAEDIPLEWLLAFAADKAIKAKQEDFLNNVIDLTRRKFPAFPSLVQWEEAARKMKQEREAYLAAQSRERHTYIDQELHKVFFLLTPLGLSQKASDEQLPENWPVIADLASLAQESGRLQNAMEILQKVQPLAHLDGYRQEEIDGLLEKVSRAQIRRAQLAQYQAERQKHDLERAETAFYEQGENLKRALEQWNNRDEAAEITEWEKTLRKNLFAFLYRAHTLRSQGIPKEKVDPWRKWAVNALESLSSQAWKEIADLASQRYSEIQAEMQKARASFENGNLEDAIAWLDGTQPRLGGSPEWRLLKQQVEQVVEWLSWLDAHQEQLGTDDFSSMILKKIQEFRQKNLPEAYWKNSPAEAYLQRLEQRLKAVIQRQPLNQPQFFEALCHLLELHWRTAPLSTSAPWNGRGWLRQAYQAASLSRQNLLDLIIQTPAPASMEEALNSLSFAEWQALHDQAQRRQQEAKRFQLVLRRIGSIAGVLLLVLGGGYLFFLTNPLVFQSAQERAQQLLSGTFTPTVLPSASPTVTPTPTFTPTPLPTATLTPTPVLPSAFRLAPEQISMLYPPPPITNGEAYWVIDDTVATFDPPRGTKPWVDAPSTDPDAKGEKFAYAASGAVSVTWSMDQPFDTDGYYQVFIADPAQQSGGVQPSFEIRADGQPLQPYRGEARTILQTYQQFNKDSWRSLGIYALQAGQRLEVSARAENLSQKAMFGADRILIVRLNPAMRAMVDALPQGRPLVSLLDDGSAEYNTFNKGDEQEAIPFSKAKQLIFPVDRSWNGSIHAFPMPAPAREYVNLQINWQPTELLPAGTYEVYVWIPAEHATAIVEYQLLASYEGGKPAPVPREVPAKVNQADWHGQWVTLGTWKIDKEARLGLRLIASLGEAIGEVGVDAVAIVRAEP